MLGRIIGLVSCLLCAFPFFVIAVYNKDSREPINFWSGDTTLKKKVKNIKQYNLAMASLYQKCAYAFIINGLAFLVFPAIGIIMLCMECTIGIYVVYKNYKKILEVNS